MTVTDEIRKLKEERNAVILAHYYTIREIQELADYTGDSFYLSKLATELPNKTIVFCGVTFMGESAKLLNQGKEVIVPAMDAVCPMALMVTKEEVEEARRKYDDLAVVCYINSTAEVKSWSDVSVTSANALKIIRKLPNKNILFIPDRNLGRYIAEQIPEKNVMTADGFCLVHEYISENEILALKERYPEAEVLAHPECRGEVLKLADFIGSTSAIIKYARDSFRSEFIIATETGVRYELEKQGPGKHYYFPETLPVCRNMKKITLDKLLAALKEGAGIDDVEQSYADQSRRTLERMMELSR